MSYSNDEILQALESSPIGGGTAYDESAGKIHPSDADIEVSTAEGLVNALDSSDETIAIENDAVLDLTEYDMLNLEAKTLVSYRGWDEQDGALLYTDSRGYYGSRPYTLFYSDESPRVTGLRIRGARHDEEFTRWDYDDNLARAIMLRGSGGEIDNCELWGWTWNAVHLKGDGEDTITEAEVHHNHLHKSYQIGYGYAVDVWRGFGHIHHNYFDEARHAIDGYGWWNSGYIVENNVFGPRQYSHTVDMHSLEENSASDRAGDDQDDPNYDLRAGGEMEIRNNTFTMGESTTGGGINAITIRGLPWDGVWIENNRFAHPERPPSNSGNTQEGFAWRQVNLDLSGREDIPQDDEGYSQNWNDSNNQFDAPDTPWDPEFGAPIDLTDPETSDDESEETDSEANDEESDEIETNEADSEDEETETEGNNENSEESEGDDENGEESESSETDSETEDTVITIQGQGSTVHYMFTVDGSTEKSTAYGGTINPYDEIHDSAVTGRTTNEPDSYAFAGEITDFTADGPVDISLNGQSIGIWI